MPYTDYDYNDPLHIVWRKGTPEDPYLDRAEYLKVVNQTIVLSEIPDKFHRVRIQGLTEANIEKITHNGLAEHEFAVNYANGVIKFNEGRESETMNITYKGKGFIQYPSDRIYHYDKHNNVVKSLEEIIEVTNYSIKYADLKIKEVDKVVERAEVVITETQKATDVAEEATEKAVIATDHAMDAYRTTRLVFKPYTSNFLELKSKYPNPEVGWTVQVYDSGIRYRWDGINWVAIDLFGGNIPNANHNIDGLMSKEDKKKLDDFSDESHERVIVFCIPQYPENGIQHVYARFPYKGEILNVRAFSAITDAVLDTEIAIQSSTDMVNWQDIMGRSLVLRKNEFFDDGLKQITKPSVNKNTIFRLDFRQIGDDLQNVTVEIIIKTIK